MKNRNSIVKAVVGLLVMVCFTACPKGDLKNLQTCIAGKAQQDGVALTNVTVKYLPAPKNRLWVGYTTAWDASHLTEADVEIKKVAGYICACPVGSSLPSEKTSTIRAYSTKAKLEEGWAVAQSGPGSGGDEPILAEPKPGGGPGCTCTGSQSSCK